MSSQEAKKRSRFQQQQQQQGHYDYSRSAQHLINNSDDASTNHNNNEKEIKIQKTRNKKKAGTTITIITIALFVVFALFAECWLWIETNKSEYGLVAVMTELVLGHTTTTTVVHAKSGDKQEEESQSTGGRNVTTTEKVVLKFQSSPQKKKEEDKHLYYHRAIQAAQTHADWQNAILNNNNNHHSETLPKFLIFKEVTTGLGNRMEAALSAYLYAMATGRIFVMRKNSFQDAIQFPLDPIEESDPRVALHLKGLSSHDVKIEPAIPICDDFTQSTQHSLNQHRVLVLEGNMYFGDLLFYNPYLRPWLEERFGPRNLTRNNPFFPLYRWLVRPKPEIQTLVNDVLRKEFSTSDTIIGLQVRMSESYAKTEQMSTFWKCAWQAAKELGNNNTTKFFLSTDHPGVQRAAREEFGNKVFWLSNLTKIMSTPQFRDLKGAVADVTLLAECHGHVVTQSSSFGRLGYGASPKQERPWYVTIQSNIWNIRRHPPNTCRRALTNKLCSDRVHRILYDKRTAPCLSESDKQEAIDECDMS